MPDLNNVDSRPEQASTQPREQAAPQPPGPEPDDSAPAGLRLLGWIGLGLVSADLLWLGLAALGVSVSLVLGLIIHSLLAGGAIFALVYRLALSPILLRRRELER